MVTNCPALERKKKREQDAGQSIKGAGLVTILGKHSSGGLNSTTLKSSSPITGNCGNFDDVTTSNFGGLNSTTVKSSPLLTGNCSNLDVFATSAFEKSSPPLTSTSSVDSAATQDYDFEQSNPFVSSGKVSIGGSDSIPIQILRDTGASQSLLLSSVFNPLDVPDTDDFIVCKGIGGTTVSVPLHVVHLQSDLVTGDVTIGLIPDLPMTGVSLLLGNDLAGGHVVPCVELTSKPNLEQTCDVETYPACVVTRSMSRRGGSDVDDDCGQDFGSSADSGDSSRKKIASDGVDLADTMFDELVGGESGDADVTYSRKQLEELQKQDDELMRLRNEALSESEIEDVPVGYYVKDGVLMRKYRPPDVSLKEDWSIVHQVVVPKPYRNEILSMAHDLPLSGHLGIRKTKDRILRQFFWPGMDRDVKQFCKSCHTCQVVGKYQTDPPVAPLQPIPVVGEPFSRVVIDCVGPLPKTRSGNQYILTIMCANTRFPEGFPVRNIKTRTITKVLLKFFTTFGLP